jgi:hypothetical protein
MHANTTELFADITQANNYLSPGRIATRYRAITGCSNYGTPLPRVTMREMVQAVIAHDDARSRPHLENVANDELSRRLSE